MKHIVHLQALASAPDRVAQAVEELPSEVLGWSPAFNEWSVQMIVAHLYHAEPLFRARLARIALEDNPTLSAFGPDEASPMSDKPFDDLLIALRATRQETLDWLYALSPTNWERPALHETQGQSTLYLQAQNIVHHDTTHLGQLYDLCRAWEHHSTAEQQQAGVLLSDGSEHSSGDT